MNSYARQKLKGSDVAEETVPCKVCGEPTTMTGTKLCDPCWEVDSRLRRLLAIPKARNYLVQRLIESFIKP